MEQKDIIALLLLPIIFCFCYLIWRYQQSYQKKKYDSLFESGIKTQAVVSDVFYKLNPALAGIFRVDIMYAFKDTLGNEQFGHASFEDKRLFGTAGEIKEGDSIAIYYLPKKPSVNEFEEIVLKKRSTSNL